MIHSHRPSPECDGKDAEHGDDRLQALERLRAELEHLERLLVVVEEGLRDAQASDASRGDG